ncbi:hypothetical protein niasHT_010829 [Heterodera trifolii]|uniref:Major facilitator superfamily (MFS) profile domain-containing protein n=1 Tax=Heterodera trifolii TaxID=157864 RepID=A0ABD2KX89_9BILA
MALICASLNTFHLLVIFTWQFMILFATQMLFGIFTTFTPKWRCSAPTDRNFSVVPSAFGKDCSIFESCDAEQIEFEAIPFASAAVDFQWICGTGAYTKALYSQIQFFGVLLGTVLLAPLSDTYGRKPIGLITFFFGLLSLALSALSPNWQWLLFGRFTVSLLMGGSLVVVATFTMEIMPPEHRMILRTFCNWGISRLILTSLCFLFPDWRSASIVCAIASVPGLLIMAFLLPESPIWLHSQNRLDEMLRSEKQIARLAGVEHAPVEKRTPIPERKANFWSLVSDRSLFSRLLVLWMMWFTSSMSSYSVDLNSSNLSGDLFLNQLLLSIPVIISKLMLLALDTYMPKFSRRNLHHFAQLIVIFCFIVLTVLVLLKYEGQATVLVMNQLGNVFIQFTWDACYLSGTELMPTVLRASAMASFSLVGQFGALIAPAVSHWQFKIKLTMLKPSEVLLLLCFVRFASVPSLRRPLLRFSFPLGRWSLSQFCQLLSEWASIRCANWWHLLMPFQIAFVGPWILFINLFGVIFLEFTWDANVLSAVESMPTLLRSSALGSCSCIARVGGFFAPVLVFFNEHWGASAYLAVSLLGSANLFVSWMWLVDTKGVDLDAVILDEESAEGEEAKKSWTRENQKGQNSEGEMFLRKA